MLTQSLTSILKWRFMPESSSTTTSGGLPYRPPPYSASPYPRLWTVVWSVDVTYADDRSSRTCLCASATSLTSANDG
jgi:hypothetical protein